MHISEHLKDESSRIEPDDARAAGRLWSTFDALDQTQLAVVISDVGSVIQYVNQGFTRMMGYAPDEIIGRSISDLVKHSVDDRQQLRETLESGGAWRDEYPITRKDGSTVWIYNVVSPILDENGVITHYVGIGEDVSELKQANEVLHRREDRYRVLVEKAQDVVYTTDSHGRFDYVNPRTFELTGYTRQETVGQRFTMLVHPDWQDGIESFYRQQLRDQTPETLREFPIITKSGRIKWVEQTVVLMARDDEVTGFQAIVRDVSRRKQAEAEAVALVRENAVIAEITRIISSSLDVGEVYDAFAAEVNKLINFDRMVVNLVDHNKGVYKVAYGTGISPSGRETGAELPLENSFTGLVASSRTSIIGHPGDDEPKDTALAEVNSTILEAGIKTTAGFPLVSLGEVIGVMILDSFTADAYGQRHQELGDLLARNIVGVIVNAQMHSRIQREGEERAALAEIGRIIDSSVDIQDVYPDFIEQVNSLIPSDRIVISLLSADGEVATNTYAWGVEIPGFRGGDSFRLQGTAIGKAVSTRKPVILRSDSEETFIAQFPTQAHAVGVGLRSIVIAPLVSEDKIIGVLSLRPKTFDAYTDDDVALTERISAQIAGAVHNSQLHAELERESKERQMLAEIGWHVSSSLDIAEVYEAFAERVRELISVDRLTISTINADEGTFTNRYLSGIDVPARRPGITLPLAGSLTGQAVRTRSTAVVMTEDKDELVRRFPGRLPAFDVGLRSFMAVPLESNGVIIAVLHVRSVKPNAYTDRDIDLAERVGAQIASAIDNAQMHLQIQREAEERAALAEIGRIIDSSIKIQDVYQRFIEVVNRLIPSDRIAVLILDDDQRMATTAYIWGTDLTDFRPGDAQPIRNTAIQELVSTRKGLIRVDESLARIDNPTLSQQTALIQGLHSLVTVPLISDDRVIGALVLRAKSPTAYGERDLETAELIGAQIAGAVANAQMHSQIQREADERAVLAEISRVMDSSTDIQDIFQTFTEQVNKLLQSDRIAVTLLNQDGVTATNAYVWGVDIPGFGAGETFAARTSAIGRVARTHKPILMNSESESADFDEFPLEESRLQSLLMVPLVSEDRLMGVLSLRSKQPDAYTNQDLDLAERISAQISGAVANAVLRSELQRNADLRGRLATIGRIVSSNVNIDEVYESFIEQVNALIPSDRIVVAILSEDQTSATNAYVWGTDVSDFSSGAVHTIQNTSLQHLVETRRGLIIREDPDNSAVSRVPAQVAGMARGLLSMVAAPLISGDKVIGGLNLRSKTPDAYGQRELELAELIGAQIAGAIDNAQKNLQIQQEAKERTALAEIGRIIDSSIDIQDVYQRFIEQVNLLIPSDRIVVSVFDDEQRIVTNAYVWGTDISGFNLGAGHPIQNTSLRSAIQTRRGSIVRDEAATAVADRTPSQIAALAQGLRSLVAAPLTSGDKVIGALVLRSKTPSAYDRRDVEIAELIAAQIAGAVANAQMHLQIQRQAEERAALAEIGRIINSSIDIQDVYPRFIEVVNRLIPSDRIAVALMNPEEDAVINTYVWGTEIAGLGVGGVTPVQGTAIETLFNTRKGVVMAVNSPEEFIDQFPAQVASIAVGLRSMILAPLTADDKMIGALLLRSRQPNAYNVREMELAERIAAQISGAVANSQLHADVRKQALERQVLNEIGRIISSTLDVEDVYDIFADRVRKLLPFDNLIINIVDTVNEGFRRAYSIGTTRSPIPDGVMAPSKGTLLHDVVTAKQTMHFRVNDRDTVKRKYPLLIRVFDRGYRSFIGVPLISNDQVVGTLHFNSKDIDVYTENEVSLATRIGSQIAGAVANSLMFAAQQRAERLLEQSNEELEITVQARTSELSKANSSLQNSQDQLRALAARMEMIREDERTHISHEIHDEIGQALTGLKFDIAWIRRRMDGLEDDDLRKAVSQRILSIYGDIDKNINLVRDLSTRLRPAALDNFGLSAAIESETLEFQERTNIKCEVNTPDEDIDIGKDAALGVFRILQEAMTNAARHARPTTITVDLEQDSEQIILRITDDGKGMADISDTSSLGLLGMKERARLMGGDLRIESALNKGTTVLLSAPIQGQATE